MPSIPRTGITEIFNEEIRQDGYCIDDLRVITLSKMTEYIGSEETFPRAWEITCSKAKSEVYPPINLPVPEVIPVADEPKELPELETEDVKGQADFNITNTKRNDSKKNK